MSVPPELYESLRRRVNVFSRESKRVFEGDVDALHRTRIASRRLRELLPVLHHDADTTRKLRRRLRRVTRQLGMVRDFDVLTHLVSELARDRRHPRAALRVLDAELKQQRGGACQELEAKLPRRKLQKLARRLKRMAKHVEPADASEQRHPRRHTRTAIWALDALVVRRAALVREASASAGTAYNPQQLHDVRVAVKKLRYSVELQAEARDDRVRSEIRVLKATQDLLGRLHDFQVLIEHARRLQGVPPTPDRSSMDLTALVRALERDCRQLHARYVRDAAKLVAIVGKLEKPRSPDRQAGSWLGDTLLRRRPA
jgi:CHAD domain-containing protein